MKKLLFVMFSLNNGGAERSLVNLLCELEPKRYQIDLLLFAPEGMFLQQVPEYVNIIDGGKSLKSLYTHDRKEILSNIYLFCYKLLSTALTQLTENSKQAQNAARWIKYYSRVVPRLEQKYDVAIAYISRDIMYYVVEKVEAERKIVFVHNDYKAAGHPKKYDVAYFEKVDAVATISDTCAKILKEEFPAIEDRIFHVPNIVSERVIRERAANGVADEFTNCNEMKIVSVGRLHEQKGFDWAIQAAELLKKKRIRFQWLIIGNGELQKSLGKLIDITGTGDVIHLIGPRENPYSYIKAADIVVQSSRWEGKSVVLDEAKIIGIPIVTTNYPTVKDQIQNGDEGLIVDMSPEGIADGIETLARDKQLWEHIHNYLLEQKYGNSNEIAKYYKLFDV